MSILKFQAGGDYSTVAKELKSKGLLDKFKELDKKDTGFKLSEVSPELAKKYGDLQYHGKPNQKVADDMNSTQAIWNKDAKPFVKGDMEIYPQQGLYKNKKTGSYMGTTDLISQKQLNAFGLTPDSLAKIQPKKEVKEIVKTDTTVVKPKVTEDTKPKLPDYSTIDKNNPFGLDPKLDFSKKPVTRGGSGYGLNSKFPYNNNPIREERQANPYETDSKDTSSLAIQKRRSEQVSKNNDDIIKSIRTNKSNEDKFKTAYEDLKKTDIKNIMNKQKEYEVLLRDKSKYDEIYPLYRATVNLENEFKRKNNLGINAKLVLHKQGGYLKDKHQKGGIFKYQTGGLTKPKSLQEADKKMFDSWAKSTKPTPIVNKPYVKPPLATGAIEITASPIEMGIFGLTAPARGLGSMLLSQVSTKPLTKLAGSALDIVDPTALGFKKFKEKGYNTHKNTSLDNTFNTAQRYTEQASNVDNVNDYRNYMSLQDKTIEKPKQELKTKSNLEKALEKKKTILKQG